LDVGAQVTVYLRKDEVHAITHLMVKHHLKRHQAIKLAIRYFLFPKERLNIPLDGKVASVSEDLIITEEKKEGELFVS
jgi:hypothetical protein